MGRMAASVEAVTDLLVVVPVAEKFVQALIAQKLAHPQRLPFAAIMILLNLIKICPSVLKEPFAR